MSFKLKEDVYNSTIRIMEDGGMRNAEIEFTRLLNERYDFRIVNTVFGYEIQKKDFANENGNYLVYLIQTKPRNESLGEHEKLLRYHKEMIIQFINIALKYHLKIVGDIEIRMFDLYEEIYYDFQNIYNVHFDADEYYRSLNPDVVFYRIQRLYRPVVLFNTEMDRLHYSTKGLFKVIQKQYKEFIKLYDKYHVCDGEEVVFSSLEEINTKYDGNIIKYLDGH